MFYTIVFDLVYVEHVADEFLTVVLISFHISLISCSLIL